MGMDCPLPSANDRDPSFAGLEHWLNPSATRR